MLKIDTIIWKSNFRQFKVYNLTAIIMLILIPTFISVSYLVEDEVIYLTEHFISLIGIVMLTPITMSENNSNIRSILLSKKKSILVIWLTQMIMQLVLCMALIFVTLEIMLFFQSMFSLPIVFFYALANTIYLGGLGFFTNIVFHNWIIGYLVPLAYYAVNMFFSDSLVLTWLPLFSNNSRNILDKITLLIVGIFFVLIGFLILELTKKQQRF